MSFRYPLVLFLGVVTLFIAPTTGLQACGSAFIDGPSYCEDGVDPNPPVAYTADVSINCTGCQIHKWTLTGGMFVDENNQPLVILGNGQPMENGTIKITECDCKSGDPPCFPVFAGGINSNGNNIIHVRWNPAAQEQKLKLKAEESEACVRTREFINKKAEPATGITRNEGNCSNRQYTAQLSSTSCPPSSFRWFRDGTFIPSQTGQTATITHLNVTNGVNISVEPVYGNTIADRITRSAPPLARFPPFITGPSIVVEEGRPYSFSVNNTNATVLEWRVSTTRVSLSSTTGNNTMLNVDNILDDFTFEISVLMTRCGVNRWFRKQVTMDVNCTGRDCDFVSEQATETSDQTTVSRGSGESGSPLNGTVGQVVDNKPATFTEEITLTPNPVGSERQLTVTNLPTTHRLQLFDIAGRAITQWIGKGEVHRLDLSEFGPGTYILAITGEADTPPVSRKFIIR